MDINFGIKPFWFWNADITEEELKRQIKLMKMEEIGGFFIHPRQGLEIPYLSIEWFEKVRFAVEMAKENNLEVWLYDEYPYPSGISGGEVAIKNADYIAYILDYKTTIIEEDSSFECVLPWCDIVLARAYKMIDNKTIWNEYIDLSDYIGIIHTEKIYQESGLTSYNRKRFFTGNLAKKFKWTPRKGKWKVFIFYQFPLQDFKYFETFIDPLNKDAVKCFIQTTHEKYKKYLGDEFGKTIKGIFTDETAPFGGKIPWSRKMEYLFQEKYKYSITENLPALFDDYGLLKDKIRFDYMNLVVDTFIDSYDRQIQEWCHNNNLLYVGEKPILRSEQLKFVDIPGIDAGHQKAGDKAHIVSTNYRANPKIASSASFFYEKPYTLCECFHSIGWSTTLQDIKWTFDWLMLQGIDMFVPHAFYYSTDGLRKHDAPPSCFYQMPWWEDMHTVSEYLKTTLSVLKSFERKVDILLLDPICGTFTCLGEKKQLQERLKNNFHDIQKVLLSEYIDYYVCDPRLLCEAKVSDGLISLGNGKFSILIIPPMLCMEKAIFDNIKRLINNKANVLFSFCLPIENIENVDLKKEFDTLFNINSLEIYQNYLAWVENISLENENYSFIGSMNDFIKIVNKYYKKDIEIITDSQDESDILTTHYIKEDKNYFFFVNTSSKHKTCKIRLMLDKHFDVYIDHLDGSKKRLIAKNVNNENVLTMNFSPFESCMIELCNKTQEKLDMSNDINTVYKLNLLDEFNVKTRRMNALRIDKFQLQVNEFISKTQITAKPIVDQLTEAKIPIIVETKSAFGCPKELKLPVLNCIYSTCFYVNFPTRLWLMIEPTGISGNWYIMVNKNKIKPEVFENKEFYLPTNLACDISKYVCQGKNVLEIYIDCKESYDGVVNPIYIFGHFGVFKEEDKWLISAPKETGQIGKNILNGLPFYAGKIIYSKAVTIDNTNKDIMIYIDDVNFQDAATLYFNSFCAGSRTFSPYKWLIPKEFIKENGNWIELHVNNTLIGLFEGQEVDPITHKIIDL